MLSAALSCLDGSASPDRRQGDDPGEDTDREDDPAGRCLWGWLMVARPNPAGNGYGDEDRNK
jgi:hypothetical protein